MELKANAENFKNERTIIMKKTLGFIALSAFILAAGFFAMSLPFHLFDELTPVQMRLVWIFELAAYFIIVCVCLSAAEKRIERKKSALKEKQRARENTALNRGQDYDAAA